MEELLRLIWNGAQPPHITVGGFRAYPYFHDYIVLYSDGGSMVAGISTKPSMIYVGVADSLSHAADMITNELS